MYGNDEIERLAFIGRLKAMGLSLAEIRELNAVYAIEGSTRAMLSHLEELLERRQSDLESRIVELRMLRDQIEKYRGHVASRISVLATQEDEAE